MNALVSTPSASAVKRTRADLEGVVVTPATTASVRKAQRSTSGAKVSGTVHVAQIIFRRHHLYMHAGLLACLPLTNTRSSSHQ